MDILGYDEVTNVYEHYLQEMWRRMKQAAKVESRKFKKETQKTGGGKPPADLSEQTVMIQSICPYDFKQYTSSYDDDNQDTIEDGESTSPGIADK